MFQNKRSLGDEQVKIRSDLTKQQIEIVFLMDITSGKVLEKQTLYITFIEGMPTILIKEEE